MGQIKAVSVDDANELAQEVFGPDVNCRLENKCDEAELETEN